MTTACAWCGAWLSGSRNRPATSHGICGACAAELLARIGLAIERDEHGVARQEFPRGSQVVRREPHKLTIAGSNPAPATGFLP